MYEFTWGFFIKIPKLVAVKRRKESTFSSLVITAPLTAPSCLSPAGPTKDLKGLHFNQRLFTLHRLLLATAIVSVSQEHCETVFTGTCILPQLYMKYILKFVVIFTFL